METPPMWGGFRSSSMMCGPLFSLRKRLPRHCCCTWWLNLITNYLIFWWFNLWRDRAFFPSLLLVFLCSSSYWWSHSCVIWCVVWWWDGCRHLLSFRWYIVIEMCCYWRWRTFVQRLAVAAIDDGLVAVVDSWVIFSLSLTLLLSSPSAAVGLEANGVANSAAYTIIPLSSCCSGGIGNQ